MSNVEKLIERLRSKPTDMRFEEVERVLENHGYVLRGSKGSHRRFERPGWPMITVPVARGHVERVYLARLVKLLSIEEEC